MVLHTCDSVLPSQLPNQVLPLVFSSFADEQTSRTPAELGCVLSFHPGGLAALVTRHPSPTLCCLPHEAASKIKCVLKAKSQPAMTGLLPGIAPHLQRTGPAAQGREGEKKNHCNNMQNPRCSQYRVTHSHPVWEVSKDSSQLCREEVNIPHQSWENRDQPTGNRAPARCLPEQSSEQPQLPASQSAFRLVFPLALGVRRASLLGRGVPPGGGSDLRSKYPCSGLPCGPPDGAWKDRVMSRTPGLRPSRSSSPLLSAQVTVLTRLNPQVHDFLAGRGIHGCPVRSPTNTLYF